MRQGIMLSGTGILLLLLVTAGCGGSSSGAALALTGLEPAEGPVAGGSEITLKGAGFSSGVETVTFGWNRASDLRLLDDGTIVCTTPPGTHGLCDVAVATYDGGIVLPLAFAYVPPAPTLTAVTPDEGPPGVPTRLTLQGTGYMFEPVTVTIGGQPCTNVVVANDEQLSCDASTSVAGLSLAVTVTTEGGTATLPGAYSYLYPYRGDYYMVEFQGGAGPSATSRWGTLSTDGLGIHNDGEIWQNDRGATSGPTAPPPTPYQVDGARTFTWGPPGDPDQVGRLSEDGSLGILSSVKIGVTPTVTIVGRVEGTYDLASLDGLYHVGWIWFTFGTFRIGLWGTADFGGDGTAAAVVHNNVEGSRGGPFPSDDTYTVSSNGRITYSAVAAAQEYSGQILQDGKLVILSGGTEGGDPEHQALVVLVKASTGSVASFSGNYALTAMLQGDPEWDAYTGVAEAAGDGNATVTGLLGHDGPNLWDDWPQAPYDFTYSVTLNGMLEAYVDGGIVGGGGMDTQGAVLAGGDFAMFAGSRSTGERPMLWFFLR